MPIHYAEILKGYKNNIFLGKKSIVFLFLLNTLIVGTRSNRLTEAVLTSTLNQQGEVGLFFVFRFSIFN